jgi:hypothetical protein
MVKICIVWTWDVYIKVGSNMAILYSAFLEITSIDENFP